MYVTGDVVPDLDTIMTVIGITAVVEFCAVLTTPVLPARDVVLRLALPVIKLFVADRVGIDGDELVFVFNPISVLLDVPRIEVLNVEVEDTGENTVE